MSYDPRDISAPRAAGALLKAAVALVENPVTAAAVANRLLRDSGVLAQRALQIDEPPTMAHPIFASSVRTDGAQSLLDASAAFAAIGKRAGSATFESVADFARAYRDGDTTPLDVARRVLDASARTAREKPSRALFIAQQADDVLAQARAATERFEAGRSLGPLDGVPVAVKDEVDQAGYPTTVGTSFLGTSPAREDATVVARLRAAGAVLIGKTNMHEIGLGVTGVNPHHGAARNPYDTMRATGGSSSGSAAAVGAGLCPLAVGADGGGSVRIPAALCGVAGLKATFGRVSEHGAAPLCWSVAHIGPIGATMADVALGYAVMAGLDEHDANTRWQPAPTLDGVANANLAGLRVGVYRPWFEHAAPDIVSTCHSAIEALREAGASIVDVEIPDLDLVRVAHLVTIIGEMAAAHLHYYARHRTEYGLDTRLNLAIARHLRGFDLVQASRVRTRIFRHFARVLEQVDAIATPTTARTAPLIAEDSLATGESNLTVTDQIMRFAPAGNLTGLPALSIPAGYDRDGLPIGLQLMGRAWDEALLLRMGLAIEPRLPRRTPRAHESLLPR